MILLFLKWFIKLIKESKLR